MNLDSIKFKKLENGVEIFVDVIKIGEAVYHHDYVKTGGRLRDKIAKVWTEVYDSNAVEEVLELPVGVLRSINRYRMASKPTKQDVFDYINSLSK